MVSNHQSAGLEKLKIIDLPLGYNLCYNCYSVQTSQYAGVKKFKNTAFCNNAQFGRWGGVNILKEEDYYSALSAKHGSFA